MKKGVMVRCCAECGKPITEGNYCKMCKLTQYTKDDGLGDMGDWEALMEAYTTQTETHIRKMEGIQIHQCKKCGQFWEKGIFDTLRHDGSDTKWYKMLGSILPMDALEKDDIKLSGLATCPQCDYTVWINERSINGK